MASFALRFNMMAILATVLMADSCRIQHRDIRGADIHKTKASSFEQCKAKCSQNPRCTAIAYRHVLDRCFLKQDGYSGERWDALVNAAKLPCKDLWTSCPAGQRVGSDYKSCQACPINTYSSGGQNQNCQSCKAGTYSNYVRSSCLPCHAGHYGLGSGKGCTGCPPGSYTSSSGRTSCDKCPANKFSTRSGSSSCKNCPAGQWSESGATSCKPCPAGQFGSSAGKGCTICPYNFYNDQTSQTSCKPCGEGNESDKGSTSAANCFKQPLGLHCWTIKDGADSDVAGSLEDAASFEDAYKACASDSECLAVICKRRPGDTGCSIGVITGKIISQDICKYLKI